MRIAMIGSRGLGSNYGGIERVLDELCPRLVQLGHEVDVFSARWAPVLTAENLRSIPTSSFGHKHGENLSRSMLSTLKALRRYDLIHFHATGPGLFSLATRLAKQKSVVTIHALDQRREKWSAAAKLCLRSAEQAVSAFADEVTVVSEPLRRYFRERYDRDVVHIPNGLPRKAKVAAGSFLTEHGLEAGKYVLFASRLTPEKGCHDLIAAFNRTTTDVKLAIAGGVGPESYAESLRQMADKRRNVFLGHLGGGQLAEVFSNACLFVLPSYIEGMSMALLEAIAYGIPSLVSDIDENTSVVGKLGFQFSTGNVIALQQQLDALLHQPSLMSASIEAMSRTPLPDWADIALRYDNLYRAVVGEVAVRSAPAQDFETDGEALI